MKRLNLLSLVFTLLCLTFTAGYSDSSVIKETPTYSVAQSDEACVSAAEVAFNEGAEVVDYFALYAPELGYPGLKYVAVKGETPVSDYFNSFDKPPRYWCQKSEGHIRNYS